VTYFGEPMGGKRVAVVRLSIIEWRLTAASRALTRADMEAANMFDSSSTSCLRLYASLAHRAEKGTS
jgi:hypothetical protein